MELSDLILNDPAASFWLKDALRSALERDPVDAVADAETLAAALRVHRDLVLLECQGFIQLALEFIPVPE
jgi:hypothetical protein